ncbi:hypothetical protein Q604_UNBC01388G0002, partial [human gut metagenome]
GLSSPHEVKTHEQFFIAIAKPSLLAFQDPSFSQALDRAAPELVLGIGSRKRRRQAMLGDAS